MYNTLKYKVLDEFDKIYNELQNIYNSEDSTEFKEQMLRDLFRNRREDVELYFDNLWHDVYTDPPEVNQLVLLCYRHKKLKSKFRCVKTVVYTGLVDEKQQWVTSGTHIPINLDGCEEICWTDIPAPPSNNFFMRK